MQNVQEVSYRIFFQGGNMPSGKWTSELTLPSRDWQVRNTSDRWIAKITDKLMNM